MLLGSSSSQFINLLILLTDTLAYGNIKHFINKTSVEKCNKYFHVETLESHAEALIMYIKNTHSFLNKKALNELT